MEYLRSSRIYFADGIRDGYLAISQGRIAGFLTKDAPVDRFTDYGDLRIIPGIFDTHDHGTYGYGDSDLAKTHDDGLIKDDIRHYLHALTYEGVTNIFPTETDTLRWVAQSAKEGYDDGAFIQGIHSEGPYLNRVGEGGRPEAHPEVDMDYVRQMWDDSQGLLRLVAMAPEIPGTYQAAEFLRSKGVKIAFAHSDCKAADARKAVDAGWRVSTHTSNVMVGIHHRDIGGLGVMLMDPRVQCEVICDGLHVCMDFIEMMFRIKDHSKFMMISDSVSLAGIAPGRYEIGWVTPLNVSPEGFVRDDDGRLLGSSKSVLYGIGNLVEKLHIPLQEVIRLSSLNAARYYGVDDVTGSIADGKYADLAVISDDYKAQATYVHGRKVFDRAVEKTVFNPRYGRQD
mgnify:CR=1 FL=1